MKRVKAHEEQKAVPGAVVAVTNRKLAFLFFIILSFSSAFTFAAILPEERADVLYHSYEGGGVKIDGPSVLVRKNVGDKFSFSGNYYVDMITSASIDVVVNASEYTEERTEFGFGMDYLNDRTIMSFNYSNSSENDYTANTIGYTISQEFFGDLSTLTLGFSLGDDTIEATGAPDFEASADRRRYSLGFSQILTKRFIASFSYESVFDEGFLRNPYRTARTVDPVNDPLLVCNQDNGTQGGECYPETRNSEAFALRGIYAFTNYSSLRAEIRRYSDSWDIESQNIELRYSHQWGERWLFETRVRHYNQSEGAFFYQDIFDTNLANYEFFARDKELSQYTSNQFGISVSYTFKSRYAFFNNSTLNFSWDIISFDYDNFRDASNNNFDDGSEPFYSFDADVYRLFYSAYF